MRIDILTLFPGMFKNILVQSIIKRAIEGNLVKINLYNLRDYTHNTHRTADDKPFGGGPGMVMKPEPIFEAVEDILKTYSLKLEAESISEEAKKLDIKIILLTPGGKKLNQKILSDLSKCKHLILICGHYEGIDERVREYVATDEISIGNYILTGGEIPAMVLIDGIIRLIPDVLGNEKSLSIESFQNNNLLECPQYTRPANYKGLKVPGILLSGDHNKINNWRRKKALARTAKLCSITDKEEEKRNE